jgi:hypothetical protein
MNSAKNQHTAEFILSLYILDPGHKETGFFHHSIDNSQ